MRTFRRAAALGTAAVLATLASVLPALPARGVFGGTPLDEHTSYIPTSAYEISSSSGGTVYSADVGGFGHVYAVPATMSTGSLVFDLGPRPFHRMAPTIVGTRVAWPAPTAFGYDASIAPVTQVRSCTLGGGGCFASTLAIPSGWAYVGNGGTYAIVYNLTTQKLGTMDWAGTTVPVQWSIPFTELPEARGDGSGVLVDGDGDVRYVAGLSSGSTITDLGDGNPGAVLTPTYVAWYLVGVGPEAGPWVTKVYRALRSSPGTVTSFDLAGSPDFERFAATDAGAAWAVPNGDGTQTLTTRPWDGTAAAYSRLLDGSGLSPFQSTTTFLVNDRRAGIPGFYQVSAGSYSGTLVGLVPSRPSNVRSLALSNGRAVYSDDTTEDIPAYLRSVGEAGRGPESAVASAADGGVALAGPYAAYAATGTVAGMTDVYYGRTGGAFTRRTYPSAEVGSLRMSGQRLLLTGGTRSRVIDIGTGAVTDLGHVYAAIFGEHVAMLSYDNGSLVRRNLVTGATVTLRPAVAGCATSCVDEEGWLLSMWGTEVVWAFTHAGTTPGYDTGWNNGVTNAVPMLTYGGEPDAYEIAYWDGMLLVSRVHDFSVHLYDLRHGAADTEIAPFAEEPIANDGLNIGWRSDSDLQAYVEDIRDFSITYAPTPRYLGGTIPGGFGPGSPTPAWQPSFLVSNDFTGTLQLHSGSASGTVVRSIAVTSVNGEIAPTWDGKDDNAVALPQGTYYWTLSRAGGSPIPVTNAAGDAPASGSVYLSTTPLGAPSLTAPALASDTSGTSSFGISWTVPAGAPAGTRYAVQRSTNGGVYSTWTTTTATSATFPGGYGNTYRFKVQAIDPSGRAGALSAERSTVVPWDDGASGTVYSSGWTLYTNGSRWAGRIHYSGTAGATYTFKSTGTAVWLIGDKAPGFGQFQVSIDGGAYSGLIDTYSATTRLRQVLYGRGSLANTAHTIRVRVYGTSGRPRVGIDGVAFRR